MKTIHQSFLDIKINEAITLAIGNFDGVHQGHQEIIKMVKTYTDTKHAIMTFSPHPISILRKKEVLHLMSIKDKEVCMKELGIDYFIIVEFTLVFSQLSVEEFIHFLRENHVKRLVVGRDFKFAHKGSGSVEDLKNHFELVIIEDALAHNIRISSTYIKDLLLQGSVDEAKELLTRSYQITGSVIHGDKVGRKIGFPTINVFLNHYVLPLDGVYYVKVIFNHKLYHGMANLGNNVTLNYSHTKRLEVYLFDFNQVIYDQEVSVRFEKYIRPEIKFDSKEALIERIKQDEKEIKNLIISKI